MRDTPSAKIIAALIRDGYTNIIGYDPVANDEFRRRYDFPMTYCDSYKDIGSGGRFRHHHGMA